MREAMNEEGPSWCDATGEEGGRAIARCLLQIGMGWPLPVVVKRSRSGVCWLCGVTWTQASRIGWFPASVPDDEASWWRLAPEPDRRSWFDLSGVMEYSLPASLRGLFACCSAVGFVFGGRGRVTSAARVSFVG